MSKTSTPCASRSSRADDVGPELPAPPLSDERLAALALDQAFHIAG
jgi:hypothetical protein